MSYAVTRLAAWPRPIEGRAIRPPVLAAEAGAVLVSATPAPEQPADKPKATRKPRTPRKKMG